MLCLIFLNTQFSKNTHSQTHKSLTEDLNFFFITQDLIVGCLFDFLKVYLLVHGKGDVVYACIVRPVLHLGSNKGRSCSRLPGKTAHAYFPLCCVHFALFFSTIRRSSLIK